MGASPLYWLERERIDRFECGVVVRVADLVVTATLTMVFTPGARVEALVDSTATALWAATEFLVGHYASPCAATARRLKCRPAWFVGLRALPACLSLYQILEPGAVHPRRGRGAILTIVRHIATFLLGTR